MEGAVKFHREAGSQAVAEEGRQVSASQVLHRKKLEKENVASFYSFEARSRSLREYQGVPLKEIWRRKHSSQLKS